MSKTKDFLFSIRFRLSFLLAAGALIVIIYLLALATINRQQAQRLYESRAHSREVIFDGFVSSSSEPLKTFAYDYTFWDDMVNFAAGGGKDVEFAQKNIDPSLGTFKANVVWVYGADRKPVYSVNDFEQSDNFDSDTTLPITPEQISILFKTNGVFQYYLRAEAGIFEIHAATIHPTDDADRATPAQGYFFVGKLIGEEYLQKAGQSIEGSSELITDTSAIAGLPTKFKFETGKIAIVHELKSYDGNDIAVLYAKYTAFDIRDTLLAQNRMFKFGGTMLILMTILIFIVLFRWVIFPLTRVQRALGLQDDKPVERLKSNRDEFGNISQLIGKSISQQHQLETQNEIVEHQVQQRTAELRHEHARLQASINSLHAGFLMTDKDGHVAMHNPALVELFGFSLPKGLSHKDQPPITLEQLQGALTSFNLVEEARKCLKTGQSFSAPEVSYSTRVFSIFGSPIRLHHGEIIGCVILVSDITEEKVLDRSKDEFFTIASHELRTPLTSIKGNTSMILDYYSDELKDENLKEMLADIHESSSRLIEIVNDFLDLSSLEQDKVVLKKEEFSLEEVIERLIYEMKSAAEQKNLHLKFDKMTLDSLPKVLADKNRAKQVIYNLLGNAIKFTQQGTITIDARVEDEMVKVLISDTGRGIPIDTQKMLFHKFQQAGASLLTRDTTRGTGLGLYISKMIVEQMGGTISLEKSVENHGSTFSFTLPIATGKQDDVEIPGASVDSKTGLSEKPAPERPNQGNR